MTTFDESNIFRYSELPIELYQVLKIEGLVNSGGEAKQLISEGSVKLNGFIETRKRKKLFDGDIINFDGKDYQIKGTESE